MEVEISIVAALQEISRGYRFSKILLLIQMSGKQLVSCGEY
jgi:hypothetical protein